MSTGDRAQNHQAKWRFLIVSNWKRDQSALTFIAVLTIWFISHEPYPSLIFFIRCSLHSWNVRFLRNGQVGNWLRCLQVCVVSVFLEDWVVLQFFLTFKKNVFFSLVFVLILSQFSISKKLLEWRQFSMEKTVFVEKNVSFFFFVIEKRNTWFN